MMLIVDPECCGRDLKTLATAFHAAGIEYASMSAEDALQFVKTTALEELEIIDGIIVKGDEDGWAGAAKCVSGLRSRFRLPIVVAHHGFSVRSTIASLTAGADDVVSAKSDPLEILARLHASRRRCGSCNAELPSEVVVFADGRDPVVKGAPLCLPRRERKILECLVYNSRRFLSKDHIFRSVYGIFNDRLSEKVVESHISRLRKRLRGRLGYDAIESRRHEGYRLRVGIYVDP